MRSPRGSPRMTKRIASNSSLLLETHPASTAASERSPLLIPPRHLQQQQQQQQRRPSISSDGSARLRRTNSDRSGASKSNSNSNNNNQNCLTSSWIWQMVWSRITLLVFVAGSLILLGVGVTNLRYQRVNSLHYQQQQQQQQHHHHSNKDNMTNYDLSSNSSNSNSSSSLPNSSVEPDNYSATTPKRVSYDGSKSSSQHRSSPFTSSSSTSLSSNKQWPPTATDIADYFSSTPTTFGELASVMVPLWYQQTIDAVENFAVTHLSIEANHSMKTANETASRQSPTGAETKNTNDLEWGVSRLRTLLWSTNLLLNVFDPLYRTIPHHTDPFNSTNTIHSKVEKRTINFGNGTSVVDSEIYAELRTLLTAGYKESKKWLDVTSFELNDTAISSAKRWVRSFTVWEYSQHTEILEVLQKAPLVHSNAAASGEMTQSPFYWEGAFTPIVSTMNVSTALAILGAVQFSRLQNDLQALLSKQSRSAWDPRKAAKIPSIKEPSVQDIVRRLQKEINIVVDQQNLFQDFFIPFDENPDKAILLLKEANALLGTIRDDWERLVQEYKLQKTEKHASKPKTRHKLRTSLKMQWRGFQWWVEAVDVSGAVEALFTGMLHRSGQSRNP